MSAPAPGAPRSITVVPGTEIKYSTVESRLTGSFRGWDSRSILTLENGQRWQIAPGQSGYNGPALDRPAVKIVPGMLSTFWMTIEGVKVRVKVTPLGGS